MLAVFSVVSSMSGSVKYSDATHLPFSDPERKKKARKGTQKMEKSCFLSDGDHRMVMFGKSIYPPPSYTADFITLLLFYSLA